MKGKGKGDRILFKIKNLHPLKLEDAGFLKNIKNITLASYNQRILLGTRARVKLQLRLEFIFYLR